MFTTPYPFISADDIKKHLPMDIAISLIEDSFNDVAKGLTDMPAKVYLDLPQFSGDFRAMPAYNSRLNVAGIKWVNSHANNTAKGKPAVMALLILNNPETGEPLAILDAGELTAIRTGAAGGVAAKWLANPGSTSIGLIGCGKQAYYQARALLEVSKPNTIHLYDIHTHSMTRLKDMLAPHFSGVIHCCSTPEEAVTYSQILVTTTPGSSPIVRYEWVQPGTHINAIGADAQGKQELDPRLLQEGKIIVDDFEQASHSGEVNMAFSNGLLTSDDLSISISDIVSGKHKGRLTPDDITIFDSTGLAIQDIAAGAYLYKKLYS